MYTYDFTSPCLFGCELRGVSDGYVTCFPHPHISISPREPLWPPLAVTLTLTLTHGQAYQNFKQSLEAFGSFELGALSTPPLPSPPPTLHPKSKI